MYQLLLAVVVAAICSMPFAEAFGEPQKYLIVSSPLNHRIAYLKLDEWQKNEGAQMRSLITTGLTFPQGLAMDQVRKKLYVGDPDLRKLVAYDISLRGDALEAGEQQTIATKVETRWVAVDGVGNVFFSDEPHHRIMKVSAKSIEKGSAVPEVVYDGASINAVSAPGGIAVDNFHVFWTNKDVGTQVGSVVEGSEKPTGSKQTRMLAKNVLKSYGVCMALSNVYYTDSDKVIYGVKKSGGRVQQVSGSLQQPRGCAWDGDGTVYVADRGSNAIYSFPGNMNSLAPVELEKSFDCDDAFGLAVVSTTSAAMRSALAAAVTVVAAVFLGRGA
eukprot:gnl/TRDRNA2_/TRDRNA2_36776_c0_seq4.p1 gnl/TRDRNA2_/TRDRNA2_36776_c0~~gnl/TRDRNA2_/TRDRNA2_36776_c0_seq4.p1  ORF type:complete len:330 (-),score=73.74 gnl/TRDRNA2_/TRDRNA2_36776_c0_seq4:99-1088(-)